MIDDGYTERYMNWKYRRLLHSERALVSSLVRMERWFVLDELIWSPPFFWGKEPSKDSDRNKLFELMMDSSHEEEDENNLRDSVEILLSRPLLGARSCDLCRKWWFDEDSGLISMNASGPIRRPKHAKPSCETESGCPKGHHSSPVEMSDKNWSAWRHYLEWKPVGLTEDQRRCPTVRRNWRIIESAVRRHGIPEICQRIHQLRQ